MKKIFISLLLALAMLLCACGSAAEKAFSENGIAITLTEDFTYEPYDNCEACFKSKDVTAYVFKQDFSAVLGLEILSVKDYCDAIAGLNSAASEVKEEDGLVYYEYTSTGSDGTEYRNISFAFKGSTEFYTLQFSAKASRFEKLSDDFFKYAKTFSF